MVYGIWLNHLHLVVNLYHRAFIGASTIAGLDWWTGLDWTGMDWTQSVRNYITASRKWLFAYLTL